MYEYALAVADFGNPWRSLSEISSMNSYGKPQTLFISSVFMAHFGLFQAHAQSLSGDERRALIARDVCQIGAKFIDADSPNISFQAGQFRVEGARGSITVFEGTTPLAQIPGFTYESYQNCIRKILVGFERSQRAGDSSQFLEAFTASFELNDALNVGTCMRPAAMAGFYNGDLDYRTRCKLNS
jgi:hypothetical protein